MIKRCYYLFISTISLQKQKYGLSIARKYLNSNLKSIEEYKEIISNENIDCDFETCDSIIFTQDINRKKDIENEYKCLRSIGYTSVEILDNETIVPNIKYSIKFKNQAKFNPVKYTYALSNLFNAHTCPLAKSTTWI